MLSVEEATVWLSKDPLNLIELCVCYFYSIFCWHPDSLWTDLLYHTKKKYCPSSEKKIKVQILNLKGENEFYQSSAHVHCTVLLIFSCKLAHSKMISVEKIVFLEKYQGFFQKKKIRSKWT